MLNASIKISSAIGFWVRGLRDVNHRIINFHFFLGQLISLCRKCGHKLILFLSSLLFGVFLFSLWTDERKEKQNQKKQCSVVALVVVIDEAGIRYSCRCPNIDTMIANANEKQFKHTHTHTLIEMKWSNGIEQASPTGLFIYFVLFFVSSRWSPPSLSPFRAICECVIAAATCTNANEGRKK